MRIFGHNLRFFALSYHHQTAAMSYNSIKFARATSNDFFKVLRQRTDAYFEENNITRYANGKMVFKTIFMIALYFIPFILSLTVVESAWAYFGLWLVMGLGMAGIGLSIMHDANHGSYSSNKVVNYGLGYLVNFVGGCAAFWKMQHNVLHHTYTNIHGHDEDISRTKIIRMSPHAPHIPMHKYQHYYAWFLYGLMTLTWTLNKEFQQLGEFKERGLLDGKGVYAKFVTELLLTKVLYHAYIWGLPLLFAPVSVGVIIGSFLSMHFVAGLILGLVFQPAHVITDNEFPLPDDKGNIENTWAINQIRTTANFAPSGGLFSWYVGGLNYQIEHHLFPHICHIHYKELSKIVEQTAKEFKLPYVSEPTWFSAIANHGRMLKQLSTV